MQAQIGDWVAFVCGTTRMQLGVVKALGASELVLDVNGVFMLVPEESVREVRGPSPPVKKAKT